jgi:MtfA peptidase
VIGRLFASLAQRRVQRTLERHAIPDALWQLTLLRYPFLARRSPDAVQRLRDLTTLFLRNKEFHGVPPLTVSDEMAVAIAAQASLPVLELGLAWYDDFVGIVLHADEVVARREVVDDDGLVHSYDENLSGEAMPGGPVMLSWQDVQAAGDGELAGEDMVYNVVIHEFAHKLDMRNGEADGCPPLPDAQALRAWLQVLEQSLAEHTDEVDHETSNGVIDAYGAEGPEEFFAVSSESFFVAPLELERDWPQWYAALRGFYRQDPAGEWREYLNPPSRTNPPSP